jgi:hypothetical protein
MSATFIVSPDGEVTVNPDDDTGFGPQINAQASVGSRTADRASHVQLRRGPFRHRRPRVLA